MTKDLFEKCRSYTTAKEAIERGVYPYFIPLALNQGTEAIIKGRRLIMCGSNDYLGLTAHPTVREAGIKAIRVYGSSCTGSRFLNGTLELHEELERELAEWVGKPAALTFSTGMQTNLGAISALVGRGDVVVLDKDDHASIVDGARLSYGGMERFRHNDVANLERVLATVPDEAGALIVVDGVFSMEGDLAPVPELLDVAKKYGAKLLIDDAHGMGVMGGGRGTAAYFGETERVDLIMSTFSKALASLGGFIAGDADVVHFVKHHARSLIFSASPTPANTACALAALRVMRAEPDRPAQVLANADKMRKGLSDLGFDVGRSVTPIIPVLVGDDERTFIFWKMLFEAGVFVNAVISPAVAPGRQILRTSYMATHTDDQLDRVLEVFGSVGKKVGVI